MQRTLSNTVARTALAIALGFAATPAFAQDAAATDEPDANPEGVIIVTAQGRSQALADVPVAVSAVTAETLQNSGVSDIREVNQVAPSLLVSSTGNEANGSARIRGIGTVGDNAGLESSVPVFIDGVYRSRSGTALGELGPLDRVEILRGPQGTLGGRNSSAGLISIYTAPPEFDFSAYGAFTYGNYDAIRIEGGVNAPIGETVAARLDGVYSKRDGFYNDVLNGGSVNNRDRWMLRGQVLFEPTDDVSFRVVADYSNKDEACCAAVFVQPEFAPLSRISDDLPPTSPDAPFDYPGSATPSLTSTANPIIPIAIALGQDPRALSMNMFERDLYVTPGRTYDGKTKDYGLSGELNWDLGGAKLTSITGYRHYENWQASDTDYTTLDLYYRAPNEDANAREFKTFTQEIRLNGTAFNDRLDWLVGGYYAHEKLQARDNIRFGEDYGAFIPCRVVLAVNPALVSPTSSGCLSAGGRAALLAANGGAGAFGPATPLIFASLDNLALIKDKGTVRDVYNQTSDNFAVFTHNIIHVTDALDLTLGLRYTNETKKFDANFQNDNTICPANRALLSPLLATPLATLAGNLIALSCLGNSSSELDGKSFADKRKEDALTGTAILSYKITPDLMTYASYTRGYKAGGFNLDRSALSNAVFGNPAVIGSTAALQFDAEKVTSYEIGMKYATRAFSASIAAFRQQFSNFQLNTFNGSVFLVQTVNGCKVDNGDLDQDASAATGACSPDDVTYGVVAQGFEAEAALSPIRDLTATVGLTYSATKYRDSLVGNKTGAPLDPALRLLPGDNLSNAPEIVATASLSWTPPIGDSGMKGLFYINGRMVSDYNTGSDLLYGKEQDSYAVFNARIGLTGADRRWGIELWGQNIFDKGYSQVAFNTPFIAPQQTYSAFLAEPATYGVTVRAGF